MKIRLYSKILFCLWLAQVGFQSYPAMAMTTSLQEDQRSRSQKINALFRLGGLGGILENIESIIEVSENLNEKALPPGQGEFAKRIMRQVYSQEKFNRTLKQFLNKNYKPQHVLPVVQWHRSSLGKKIMRLESEAHSSDNQSARKFFVDELLSSPPSEERISLIEKIEHFSGVTESSKALYLGYVKLMYPFNLNAQEQRLGKMIRNVKGSITEPMREAIMRGMLFGYKDLKDRELESYSDFLSSKAGRWYKKATIEGFEKAVKKTLFQAESIQAALLTEIDSGGPDFPLVREIAPPGQRYLLIGKRDPFRPLVNDDGLVQLAESSKKSKARLFGDELKDIPPIALPVIAKIEDKHPELFRKLKKFERLINNREEMAEMSDEEYSDAIEDYRDVLERAAETKMDESPLQIDYNSLRMTGIIRKKMETVAMIEIDATGYSVRQGDRIGPYYGYVGEIQEEQLIVVEKFRDYLGNTLTNQKTLEFYQVKSKKGNSNL